MVMVAHFTILLIVAFFVWFAATKTEGLLSLFGRVLGAWVFFLGVFAIVAPLVPGLHIPFVMHDGRAHWMAEHWCHAGSPPPPPSRVPPRHF